MGCWNETCAVSKMTIYAGEPVRFLPIVQNAWHFQKQEGFPNGEAPELLMGRSGIYASDLWVPFCLPIRGEYNDYGSIENIPDKTKQDKAELAQFIATFKKNAIPLGVGENECHDVALKNFTLEEILEALQEGRVYTKYRGAGKDLILAVGWMMIKESVWQTLLETDILKTEDGSFYKMLLKDREDTTTRAGIRAAIKKQLDKNNTREKAIKDAETAKKDGAQEAKLEAAKALLETMSDFDGFGGGYRSKIWSNAPWEYRPTITKDLIDSFADAEYADSIMSLLRINYAPTCGSGSQNSNHKLWKNTMTKWKKIAHKDEHRWDE